LTPLAGCEQINGSEPSSALEKNRNPLRKFNPAGSLRVLTVLVLVQGVGLSGPPHASGQVARVSVEENFRATPNGDIIARVEPGLRVGTGDVRGNWTEVTVEGWVWARSLQVRDGGDYDLRVSVEGGENLRAEPQGEVVARLSEGTLLEELERRPGWIRVRRSAWMWTSSLESAAVNAAPAASGSEGSSVGSTGSGSLDSGTGAASTVATRPFNSRRPHPILGAPDGDTLAVTSAGVGLQVLEREGSWMRVRLEGWVWAPPGDTQDPSPAVQEAGAVTPEMLMANPDAYVGRVVEWAVQYIAVERAERVRTDFYEGEPYMLTRYGGSSGDFVYIAFPPSRLQEVEALTPLERIQVVARVRTGRAGLTGSPILDLIELRVGGRDEEGDAPR
jgi:hypothetical protein